MRAIVQRVSRAAVTAAERPGAPAEETGRIGPGLVALVGVTHGDTPTQARRLAERIWRLRVFADEQGLMNLDCAQVGGEVLVVSQFTLYGDTRRGRRPSWVEAAPSEVAEPLVDELVGHLRGQGARVATGRFGAHMEVSLVNDGPVTLLLEV